MVEKYSNMYVFGSSRKSPDDKVNTEKSISNQNEFIVNTCNKNNWNLVSIEEDKQISGGRPDRKGINKQINLAKKMKINHPEREVCIMVKDSKRFTRDTIFFKQQLTDLEIHNVKVYSIVKGDFLSYDDIGDRIMNTINEQAIIDGKNYARMSEELKTSKNLPCIPAPFGYKYDDSKNWEIDKKKSKIVLSCIRDYLNSVDYKYTIKENKITKTKYYRIIKNAKRGLYSGYIVYSKKFKDSSGNVVKEEEVKYKGIHKPIISEKVFNKINKI